MNHFLNLLQLPLVMTRQIRSLVAFLRQVKSQRRSPISRRQQILLSFFLVGIVCAAGLTACAGGNSTAAEEVTLKLVSFSVTEEAHDRIIPRFVEQWQKEHNQTVKFDRSYGGSLAQADEVINGKQEADVVHLALPLDVIRIAEAGLINSGWQDRIPRRGVVSQSVAAIVTRDGNPKNIKDWADLARSDVKVISANPQTSGIAIWQFLGLWGSVTQTGGEPEQALDFVTKVYQNVPSLVSNAREASIQFFEEKQGDVLVTYENEIILAGRNRPKPNYFVPSVNISIDNPASIVDQNVDRHGTRRVAEAFVDFLYSEEAQKEFAELGYRSVNPFVAQSSSFKFPPITTLFNGQDLGGWTEIQETFFASGGIFDKIRS